VVTRTIPVRVKPGSSVTSVGGRYPGPFGDALIVAVNAPAVDGRANQAVVKAVAKSLGLRPAAVTVRTGATARNKLLEIADPPDDLLDRFAALLGPPV
jgi:uncharacterized protein YggU (UPF0235/DUF167 family)